MGMMTNDKDMVCNSSEKVMNTIQVPQSQQIGFTLVDEICQFNGTFLSPRSIKQETTPQSFFSQALTVSPSLRELLLKRNVEQKKDEAAMKEVTAFTKKLNLK